MPNYLTILYKFNTEEERELRLKEETLHMLKNGTVIAISRSDEFCHGTRLCPYKSEIMEEFSFQKEPKFKRSLGCLPG